MNAIKVGQFIANKRKERGLTQVSLAKKIHVTDKAISKWERGLSLPDISHINSLSEALDIPIEEIMVFFADNNQEDDEAFETDRAAVMHGQSGDNEGLTVQEACGVKEERQMCHRMVIRQRLLKIVLVCMILIGIILNITGLYRQLNTKPTYGVDVRPFRDGVTALYSVIYEENSMVYIVLGLACVVTGVLICILAIKRWKYVKKGKCNIASYINGDEQQCECTGSRSAECH